MDIPQTDEKEIKNDKDSILETAKKRFEFAAEATKEIRDLGDEDIRFIAGEQWPEEISTARKLDKRPVITINRCPQMVRNVTNDQRQNRPAIKVFPVDDKADKDTAEVLQGLIRHIENDSNAEVAYDTAFDNAVKRSYGFWRVITKYESPTSFRQKALIERIRNPNRVLIDPMAQEKDARDMMWGFIFDNVLHEDYKAEYPNSDLAGSDAWGDLIKNSPGWVSERTCRVAEYFEKVFEDDTLILLSNGEAVLKRDVEKVLSFYASQNVLVTPTGKSRPTKVPVIKWRKINAVEILEENTFPGQYIPVIPCYGEEHDIDGKLILESVVRHSKDSQRIYNYTKSTEAETITLAPKNPWVVAEGQIPKQYEYQWKNSATKNYAYLTYKPTTHEDGQIAPPPMRQVYEPPIQALVQASQLASEDIKNTSGVTDAAMGNRSNEQSGIAINSRAQQAQRNNFHFTDNLNLSIKHTGRILVDIIPIIYDTPQAIRILGEDGQGQIVKIHELFKFKGVERTFDFSIGQYDVVCESGPGYATKRQEAAASMMEFTKALPQVAANVADLLVKNMDWANNSEFAERIKKTLPPGLIENPDQPPVPPEFMARLQQTEQQNAQLVEELNKQNEIVNTKRMELESKERIEFSKMDVQLILEQMKLQGAANQALFIKELNRIEQRLSVLDTNQPINNEFEDQYSPDQGMDFQQLNQQQPVTGDIPPGQLME